MICQTQLPALQPALLVTDNAAPEMTTPVSTSKKSPNKKPAEMKKQLSAMDLYMQNVIASMSSIVISSDNMVLESDNSKSHLAEPKAFTLRTRSMEIVPGSQRRRGRRQQPRQTTSDSELVLVGREDRWGEQQQQQPSGQDKAPTLRRRSLD